LEMPMLGAPLPETKFELVNRIPAAKLAGLPKEVQVFKWSRQPRVFSVAAVQKLLDESAFAGTNIASLLHSATNGNTIAEDIRLASSDNQDYFIIAPSAGRIAVHCIERSRETPPPDAVPSFDDVWKRARQLAETFGVSTNDMEKKPDGSIHVRKSEDTISRLGGTVKFESERSVMVFRSVGGHVVRSLDEDKIELELGVNGRLLKFDFKWPLMEPVGTNRVLTIAQVMDGIKKGKVLADISNEYPADGIAQVELKDLQIFYYVSTLSPYGKTSANADIRPMVELLATFISKKGEKTEGSLFAPITDSP
jgi:hypothetical protein